MRRRDTAHVAGPNVAASGATRLRVDGVVARLETEIVQGQLQPAERISEAALCDRLGCGRGPLREAIRVLEGRRLLERTPFAGVRVVDLSLDDLEQILVMREALEGLAARLAANFMTLPEIERARACLETEGRLDREGLGAVFQAGSQDNDFHSAIARASRNRWLTEMLCQDLYALLRVYRYRSAALGARAKEANREHRAVLAAIEKRDPDAAEALMRRHIAVGRAGLLERLRAAG